MGRNEGLWYDVGGFGTEFGRFNRITGIIIKIHHDLKQNEAVCDVSHIYSSSIWMFSWAEVFKKVQEKKNSGWLLRQEQKGRLSRTVHKQKTFVFYCSWQVAISYRKVTVRFVKKAEEGMLRIDLFLMASGTKPWIRKKTIERG